MLVAISYLMLTGAFYLILDTINEEPHQIKTNQDQKKWLAVLSLAQLSPSLLSAFSPTIISSVSRSSSAGSVTATSLSAFSSIVLDTTVFSSVTYSVWGISSHSALRRSLRRSLERLFIFEGLKGG